MRARFNSGDKVGDLEEEVMRFKSAPKVFLENESLPSAPGTQGMLATVRESGRAVLVVRKARQCMMG